MNRREFAKRTLMASAMVTAASGLSCMSNKISSSRKDILPGLKPVFNGKDMSGFVDINTSEDTWRVEDGLLKCTGHPKGAIRTEKQYENFILDIEWRHMEPGGNSGVFILADGTPHEGRPFPTGIEVQMLDPAWVEMNNAPEEYVHGHLFPTVAMEGTIPDNPSEVTKRRSYSLENRVNGTGEWNRYTVVCVDGVVKLSVNGKFVNGIHSTIRKKGYICPESEGFEIHFRKIDIMELPGSVITPGQIAPLIS